MARQGIFTGSTPNDGTGDSLILGAKKVNNNFSEIYSALGDGSTLLSGNPNLTVGFITSTGAEFTGGVTIGGTLTYEDVTNIDSIGIVTAQSGIEVTGGQILVGAAFSVNQSGQVVVSGVSTFQENIDIDGTLDVDGDTFLDIAVVSERLDSVGIFTARSGIDIGDPDGAGIGVSFSSRGHGYVGLLTVYDEFQVGPNLVGNGVTITSTGVNVTGIITSTSFEGTDAVIGAAVTVNSTGINAVGVVTATSFEGTDAIIGSAVTMTSSGVNITGVVTATSFEGTDAIIGSAVTMTSSGVNITGVVTATSGISTGINLPVTINVVGTDLIIEVDGVGIHTLSLT